MCGYRAFWHCPPPTKKSVCAGHVQHISIPSRTATPSVESAAALDEAPNLITDDGLPTTRQGPALVGPRAPAVKATLVLRPMRLCRAAQIALLSLSLKPRKGKAG